MDHDEAATLLGAYALDAVDPDDARAVEDHVAGCPRCEAELSAHHEVAGLLANEGGEAPPHLWDRVAAAIGPAGQQAGKADVAPLLRPGGGAPAGRRRRRPAVRVPHPDRRVLRGAAALVAAAAAAAIVVLGVQVNHLNRLVQQAGSAAQELGVAQQAQAALVDPAAHRVSLGAGASGARQLAELVILPSGTAFLVNVHLPALPQQQTYQLWGRVGGQLVSLGLLGPAPADVPLRVEGPAAGFAVTVERAGGAAQPTHPPVAASATFR